jgi:hypothetical protein
MSKRPLLLIALAAFLVPFIVGGGLMLAFPDLLPQDFQPWVDPQEASRNGMTVPEFAKKTADTWRNGRA